jgi:hypothetical protein
MSLIGGILAYIDSEREKGRSPTAVEVEEAAAEVLKEV